jgi:hypothetical protein
MGGNIRDPMIRIDEELARALDPQAQVVADRRHARVAHEQPLELPGTDADVARDPVERHGFLDVLPHDANRAANGLR